MSWNIKTPGDYINGPLTVAGSTTITGDLTVATNVLVANAAGYTGKVGIGTASPDATLDVTSAGTASTYTVSAVIQDGTYPASGHPTLEFNGFIGGNGYRAGIGSIGGQKLAFYTPSTFGVAPTRQMTLDENGRLGIGITTPAERLDIFSSAGTAAIKLQTSAYIPFTINSQIPGVSNNGFSIYDVTASANRLTIDSSGNVNVVGGNLVMGTANKGIDFTAAGNAAGMTSELLNDYEEGTWTPVVADASTGGNVGTCVINSATYTKIGRQVSVQFVISSIDTAGMAAGNSLTIRGFPFSAATTEHGNFYTYRVGRHASTVSSCALVAGGTSFVQFYLFSISTITTNLRILVSDIVSGTSELSLSVTYAV